MVSPQVKNAAAFPGLLFQIFFDIGLDNFVERCLLKEFGSSIKLFTLDQLGDVRSPLFAAMLVYIFTLCPTSRRDENMNGGIVCTFYDLLKLCFKC